MCDNNFIMRSLLMVMSLALVGATGCALEDTDVSDSENNLTETWTLRFALDDDALILRSSGRRLECDERFEGLAGERVTCERNGEKVQVIVKAEGTSVVAVRDMDYERGYYDCSREGDVEGLPTYMKCKRTTITPRGTGGLSSPFDSTAPGITIPNSHWVDEGQTVLRGMEPRTPEQFDELRAVAIEKVLIFKNSTSNHPVSEEVEAWDLAAEDVLHVPFRWKDLGGFQAPCEQTLQALGFIRESEQASEPVFYHCTVGEDRTGYLAAVYAMLYYGADARSAFEDDMCERGYASGNPQKPYFVVGTLAGEVTPLYRSMAYLVHEGALDGELDPSVCAVEPTVPDEFLSEPLICGVSTTLVP